VPRVFRMNSLASRTSW